MQINLIDFNNLDCTVENVGKVLVIRMAIKKDAPVSREYLHRAVITLLNYGAIEFIPENGKREFENLKPYNPETDDYVLLQSNKRRLRRALNIGGYINLAWAAPILCIKRNPLIQKVKGNREHTPFWKEVCANGLDQQRAAFVNVGDVAFKPSPAPLPYKLGTF